MSDLSGVKRRIIIGVRLVGAPVSRNANLVGVSRTTVSRVRTAYTNLGKLSSVKHNRGQKLKLKNRERLVLRRRLSLEKARLHCRR
ncbi:hypothetical protein TNCV_4675471 [Trichonephila clavipes]|nr:hypothetical protein TNCV_4675471 [Trichonephila clavipes]